MSFIEWDENISLDISEIDNQHKQLVEIINSLFDAMKKARGLDVIDDTLKKLIDYTSYHFTIEEKYFDQFEYSESERHKGEHHYLLEQVVDFMVAYKQGMAKRDGSESSITVDLWDFVKEWLFNHIQVSDKKYVTLFKERGL